MSNPNMAQAVVDLTQRSPQDVSLLYIGTASYDIAKYREKQTNTFAKLGVKVDSLNVANKVVPRETMVEKIDNSDIILVSGGNTLYAVDRWVYLGLDELLKGAAYQGKVMAGGSAGAICWFDGGVSRIFILNTSMHCIVIMVHSYGTFDISDIVIVFMVHSILIRWIQKRIDCSS